VDYVLGVSLRGESRESLADLYDLDPEQVDQALRYEVIASSAQAG
jgi:uncharacterized protein (DUF433 family)